MKFSSKYTQLANVINAYNLGELLREPTLHVGCHTHQVWHVSTTKGDYAVKQCHPVFAADENYCQRHRESLALAKRLHAQQFPVVLAQEHQNDFLYRSQGDYFVVLNWVPGHWLADQDITLEHITLVATSLRQYHECAVTPIPTNLDYQPNHETWQQRQEDICARYPKMIADFAKVWPMMQSLSAKQMELATWRAQDRVMSHGDFDPSNVLWRNNHTFTLIDWEWAGMVRREQDCWAVALSWSRAGFCQWDPNRFHHCWHMYGCDVTPTRMGLEALCAYWCEWIEWMMKRLLAPTMREDEKCFALQAISDLLATMQSIWTGLDHFCV